MRLLFIACKVPGSLAAVRHISSEKLLCSFVNKINIVNVDLINLPPRGTSAHTCHQQFIDLRCRKPMTRLGSMAYFVICMKPAFDSDYLIV